jgi:hypothetical protein
MSSTLTFRQAATKLQLALNRCISGVGVTALKQYEITLTELLATIDCRGQADINAIGTFIGIMARFNNWKAAMENNSVDWIVCKTGPGDRKLSYWSNKCPKNILNMVPTKKLDFRIMTIVSASVPVTPTIMDPLNSLPPVALPSASGTGGFEGSSCAVSAGSLVTPDVLLVRSSSTASSSTTLFTTTTPIPHATLVSDTDKMVIVETAYEESHDEDDTIVRILSSIPTPTLEPESRQSPIKAPKSQSQTAKRAISNDDPPLPRKRRDNRNTPRYFLSSSTPTSTSNSDNMSNVPAIVLPLQMLAWVPCVGISNDYDFFSPHQLDPGFLLMLLVTYSTVHHIWRSANCLLGKVREQHGNNNNLFRCDECNSLKHHWRRTFDSAKKKENRSSTPFSSSGSGISQLITKLVASLSRIFDNSSIIPEEQVRLEAKQLVCDSAYGSITSVPAPVLLQSDPNKPQRVTLCKNRCHAKMSDPKSCEGFALFTRQTSVAGEGDLCKMCKVVRIAEGRKNNKRSLEAEADDIPALIDIVSSKTNNRYLSVPDKKEKDRAQRSRYVREKSRADRLQKRLRVFLEARSHDHTFAISDKEKIHGVLKELTRKRKAGSQFDLKSEIVELLQSQALVRIENKRGISKAEKVKPFVQYFALYLFFFFFLFFIYLLSGLTIQFCARLSLILALSLSLSISVFLFLSTICFHSSSFVLTIIPFHPSLIFTIIRLSKSRLWQINTRQRLRFTMRTY